MMKWLVAALVGLAMVCGVLVAQAQPVTRQIDYTLVDGQILDTYSGQVIGAYSAQGLEAPRWGRSRIRSVLMATGWGDRWWTTFTLVAPTRDPSEWTRAPVVAAAGSTWAALGTTCLSQEGDGGRWRVTFRAYLVGGQYGYSVDNLSQMWEEVQQENRASVPQEIKEDSVKKQSLCVQHRWTKTTGRKTRTEIITTLVCVDCGKTKELRRPIPNRPNKPISKGWFKCK